MMRFAELDARGVCRAVVEFEKTPLSAAVRYVYIPDGDPSPVGMLWDDAGGEFVEYTPPTKRAGLSGNEWYSLFSFAEQGLWFDFVQTGNLPGPVPDEVRRALATAQGRLLPALTGNGVDLDNPLVAPSLDAMIAAGLLAAERKAQVLAGVVVSV